MNRFWQVHTQSASVSASAASSAQLRTHIELVRVNTRKTTTGDEEMEGGSATVEESALASDCYMRGSLCADGRITARLAVCGRPCADDCGRVLYVRVQMAICLTTAIYILLNSWPESARWLCKNTTSERLESRTQMNLKAGRFVQ